jgi:hypothetical protein
MSGPKLAVTALLAVASLAVPSKPAQRRYVDDAC